MRKLRSKFIYILIYILILFFFSQCSFERKVIKQPIKEQGIDFVFTHLKQNELKYEWLNIKFTADILINKQNHSLNGTIRIKKDSIVWLSLSPALGIEAFRVLITNDSLKMLNRINNTYLSTNFRFIYDFFKTTLDFDMLPAFITGNDFPYYENDKFKISIDNHKYLLSTVGRRKLRKVAKLNENLKVLIQNIWLSPETFKINSMSINEIDNNKKLIAYYSNFKVIENQLFPHLVKIEISGKDKININLKYNKVIIDEKQEFPFNIPEKYSRIEK
ncbi:MAG: DUF4292 domain-containing protein [Bacteroidota bacterium]|nr:DUF4292 domain-containing protein [Bacteroidota bacterium]